ncbi:DEAD/DEAH box helicase [Teredinibacter purpureus]|uniref:DEAD/DEAH box helicase n=1 Tax=Teredinibacter purpureus TaxID=2731756 RepID=UPI0005F836DB|nr:DEAD/DEAH box helicase [Teredinibacter purpureus]
MSEFTELGLHPSIGRALDKLEFTEPTDVQAKSIPAALTGRDLMVSSRTGSGKSAAFILPMLHRFLHNPQPHSSTRALILVPTRELALQTAKAFAQFATFTHLKIGIVMGGESYRHQVSTLRRNPEVLVATPGRLVEHIKNNNIDFSDIEMLVLDESDRMLDMGFKDAMATISEACNPARQNLLFSATLKHKGIGSITEHMSDPIRIQIDSLQSGHDNITQQRVLADDDRHKEQLIAQLIQEENAERVIVFCATRLQCQKVSNILRAKKLISEYIHGEVAQSDRKQVLNRFRDGKIQVLVATDVAARGLDIHDVDLVVNFTIAFSGDEHVHRVGRTGRADKAGLAITLVNAKDWNAMSSIERYLKIRLEPRKVKGLEADYTGPKKLKSSGKAAGTKKKKLKTVAGKNAKKVAAKKSASAKPAKIRKSPKDRVVAPLGDGSSPLRRKKNTD